MIGRPMALPSTSTAPVPTHGCVRCGRQIPLEEAMCEQCNPLGLKEPAASQVHGSVILAVGIAIVVLAVVARISVAGVGPFSARVANVASDPSGLRVTVEVRNAGSTTSATTCRITDPRLPGIGPETAVFQAPAMTANETVTFDTVVTTFGTEPRELNIACGS